MAFYWNTWTCPYGEANGRWPGQMLIVCIYILCCVDCNVSHLKWPMWRDSFAYLQFKSQCSPAALDQERKMRCRINYLHRFFVNIALESIKPDKLFLICHSLAFHVAIITTSVNEEAYELLFALNYVASPSKPITAICAASDAHANCWPFAQRESESITSFAPHNSHK